MAKSIANIFDDEGEIMFCPKCGGLMVPIKKKGKIVYKCTVCGYEMEGKQEKIIEKTKKKKEIPKLSKKKIELLPKVKIKCPRCGNTEAYTWMEQTRGVDEPPTRFYKCTKCGYVWREYA